MISFGIKKCFGIPKASTYRGRYFWVGLWAWLLTERVILVRTVQCKLSVKHSVCIKVFILVLPELELLPLCLHHFNYMWRKNSLGLWMKTFSNTPSTVSNLPLLLLLLLFSCSVVSNSLWHHGLKNYRLPCSSPFPGVFSKSCPLSRWCHPTISSSVVPFSSCLQSFPASVFSNESALCVRWPTYLYPCLSCFPLLVFKNHQGQWFHPGSLGGKTPKVHPSSQPKQRFKGRNYIHFPGEEAKIQRLRHKGK